MVGQLYQALALGCEPYKQFRVGRKPVVVHRPALTLGITAQPSVLIGLMKNNTFMGRGLLARLLFSQPEDNVGQREFRTDPLPQEVVQNYELLIWRLLNMEPETRDGKKVPHMLVFTPQAFDH